MGVDFDKTVVHGDRTFRIITYQAYNAFGLVGSEFNGVAILDEDSKKVVARNIGKTSSGYYGVTKAQNKLADAILSMTWEELNKLIEDQEDS